MALSKKPIKSAVDIEALILKGGSVPAVKTADPEPVPDEKDRKVPVQLRLSPEIVREIDSLIERRVIKVSRHAWFMEALSEKIVKERAQV